MNTIEKIYLKNNMFYNLETVRKNILSELEKKYHSLNEEKLFAIRNRFSYINTDKQLNILTKYITIFNDIKLVYRLDFIKFITNIEDNMPEMISCISEVLFPLFNPYIEDNMELNSNVDADIKELLNQDEFVLEDKKYGVHTFSTEPLTESHTCNQETCHGDNKMCNLHQCIKNKR